MRILLISPDSGAAPPGSGAPAVGRLRALRSLALKWSPFQSRIVPLGLATVAALTPDDVEVDIWDETVDGRIGPKTRLPEYALAGVTGYVNDAGRVCELGRLLRARGLPAVVGGPGVSSEPELFRDSFDVLFLGEAEYTWPRFLDDWRRGRHQPLYRQVAKVDMADTRPPRWDRVRIRAYLMGAVQTTRGCPFDCEFCDVISLFGRQARHKSVERVLGEVVALQRRGVRRLLFCDDNFIGNPPYARELVRALIPLNRSFPRPLSFFAQLTLNVAGDDVLLGLMADANFPGVFIGIESSNRDSLIETSKPQNYRTDINAAVRKIQSYGIFIQSGMIVGFDHDDRSIFDQQFEFLQSAGLPVPMINVLKAPKGTRLWARLHAQRRVIEAPALRRTANVESMTNVLPARMSIVELLTGYIDLVERVRDWNHFEARVRTALAQVTRPPAFRWRSGWIEVLAFPLLLALMDAAARRTTLRLLAHTLRRAPGMVDTVMGVVAYQYLEALRVPALRESVAEQIRSFSEEPTGLRRESAAFIMPDEFRHAFRREVRALYTRTQRTLADRGRTQDALVETARDFLTRWGATLDRFEEHHRVQLVEICDRAIAAENRASASAPDAMPAGPHGDPVSTPRAGELRRLADDILHCVERDLRELSGV